MIFRHLLESSHSFVLNKWNWIVIFIACKKLVGIYLSSLDINEKWQIYIDEYVTQLCNERVFVKTFHIEVHKNWIRVNWWSTDTQTDITPLVESQVRTLKQFYILLIMQIDSLHLLANNWQVAKYDLQELVEWMYNFESSRNFPQSDTLPCM